VTVNYALCHVKGAVTYQNLDETQNVHTCDAKQQSFSAGVMAQVWFGEKNQLQPVSVGSYDDRHVLLNKKL